MFRIIPQKNNVAVEIYCDLNKLTSYKLKKISKSKGWNLIRWITHDDNLRAKALYDRVAEKTKWNVYELSS